MSTGLEGPRSIARIMEGIGDGDFQLDASQAAFELVGKLSDHAKVNQTEASGKLTITIEISVDKKGEVELTGGIAVKSPAAPKRSSHAWLSRGGNISYEPPGREIGKLRELPKAEAPREVVAGNQE